MACVASELLFVFLLFEQVEFESLFEGRELVEAEVLVWDRVPDGCVFCSEVFRVVRDVLVFGGGVSGGVVVDG